MPDHVSAIIDQLATLPAITSLIGSSYGIPWIFDETPAKQVQNTGTSAIVIRRDGAHAAPNLHNTERFPRILLEAWSDVSRQTDRQPLREDAHLKASLILLECQRVLHMVDGHVTWSDLRLRSHCLGEPDYSKAEGVDAVIIGRQRYGLEL